MPNSYSVVPNVLPGNVSIGGNLIVGGNEIRIGGGPQFGRVFVQNNVAVNVSMNVQSDGATRDNVAQPGRMLTEDVGLPATARRSFNAAGQLNLEAFTLPVYTDYTRHTHTGTVTADTIYSKLIRGGIIGANGGLRMHFLVQSTLQGAGSTTVNLLWGGVTALIFSIAAAGVFAVDVYINNRNAANAQVIHQEVRNLTSGAVTGGTTTVAQDTTADITVGVQVQNANVGDSQNFEMVVAQLINSFGPV